jgi:hypothetical protein
MEELLSVIIIRCDETSDLAGSVESVLAQKDDRTECIVADAADGRAREFIPDEIRFEDISEKLYKNTAQVKNEAVKLASCEHVLILTSGQILEDGVLDKCLLNLSDGTYNSGKDADSLFKKYFSEGIQSASYVVVNRESFGVIGGWNEKLPCAEDYELLLRAQLQFQGCDLLEEAIPKPFMSELLGLVKFNLDSELMLSDENVMLGILRKNATVIERKEILELLSEHFQTVLYSQSDSSMLPLVENRGYLDYSTQMPVMFNQSSININITLRCILSGISLRALDIMGAGGFLLSNYQPELAEFFEDGKEMVMFYDRKDLLEKTRYYLLHDDERREIAANGRKKVEELFDYSYAWERIFGEVFK